MQNFILCNEYESGYESDYNSLYDQDFVFYDDVDIDVEDEESEETDTFDLILEDVPVVYCPSKEEFAEA